MARFDVYPGLSGSGYLLDVQADTLALLNTRAVVPLMPREEAPRPADRLNPILRVRGSEVVMVTQYIAAVPTRRLGRPVGNLANQHTAIVTALDFLVQGF